MDKIFKSFSKNLIVEYNKFMTILKLNIYIVTVKNGGPTLPINLL